jgi:ectoine hydroxylase-related dioxygenase (phytanoyl-CoA dioxygenase family)
MKTHYWNRDFAWTDHTATSSFPGADQVSAFDELGFFVVRDLIEPDLLARVRVEIDAFEAETEQLLRELDDERAFIAEAGAITFSTHLVARSPLLQSLSAHPRLLDLCHTLIGPDVRLYWDQAVYKKPEKPRRFPWHQDNGYTFIEPQQYLTVWLALTDASVDNGCPWVAPRLHRQGTLVHRYVDPLGYECLSDVPDAMAAEVPAGGAVVFSSLTPHLTGPNTTDAVRKAYILQYAPTDAAVLRGDPKAGPPTEREPCDNPDRQYEVLRNGAPVLD